MWVSNIHLRNIKSFADSGTIALSKGINVLLGANNVGKSILIKALYMLQDGVAMDCTHVTTPPSKSTSPEQCCILQ